MRLRLATLLRRIADKLSPPQPPWSGIANL